MKNYQPNKIYCIKLDLHISNKSYYFVITNKKNMQTQIINIGNSKGIRIPKTILKKYNIQDKINLILEEDCIMIKPIDSPRKGWEEEFKKMHENRDDKLLIDDIFNDETLEEWK